MKEDLINMILTGTGETLYMAVIAGLLALAGGIPIGVLLVVTDKDGIYPVVKLNKVIGILINVIRSMPEMILIIVLIPFARLVVGTSLGPNAAIVSITVGCIPFVARQIETAIKEVDRGKIEAAEAMGADTKQIITKVLIPEALPAIIRGITISLIVVIGFTALAGSVGAGGLGSLAIRFGYQRYRTDVLIATVLVLLVIIEGIQLTGDLISRRINKKRHITKS